MKTDTQQESTRSTGVPADIQAEIRHTMRLAAQFIDVRLARERTRLANQKRPDSRRETWEPRPNNAVAGGSR